MLPKCLSTELFLVFNFFFFFVSHFFQFHSQMGCGAAEAAGPSFVCYVVINLVFVFSANKVDLAFFFFFFFFFFFVSHFFQFHSPLGFSTWGPGDKGTYGDAQWGVVAEVGVFGRVSYWICGYNTSVGGGWGSCTLTGISLNRFSLGNHIANRSRLVPVFVHILHT